MIIDASKERAEMANQDGAGIITDNQNDPADGNKKEKKQKNVKEAAKASNQMPNHKDFYGLKVQADATLDPLLTADLLAGSSELDLLDHGLHSPNNITSAGL